MSIQTKREHGLYLVLISVHGLIRSDNLELGRDPDTGGQTRYVVELARALAAQPEVACIDLLTRRIVDDQVSADYARREEPLCANARIVRLDCGPEAYIRKEELWNYLDNFVDNAAQYIRDLDRIPDIIHSHYADAGYVGSRLSALLGRPLIHTGHSLGRVKRRRLLAAGLKRADIETQYTMSRRIEAEENALGAAKLIVASTHNEVDEQYALYDYYQPEKMCVIPPGTDLEKFHRPDGREPEASIAAQLARFLREPAKPMILALSRPDTRKNIGTLLTAYGESHALQHAANLVIVAGNRDDIRDMDGGPKRVLNELLLLVDRYDLYGKVAYPKHHTPAEVSVIYRLATASHGVFINPALTEPFGLTLIEAAASGLPVVATEDGGPQDIIGTCHNGILVDPLDGNAITKALLKILCDGRLWQTFSRNGVEGVHAHYSWNAHARRFLATLKPALERQEPVQQPPLTRRPMLYHDRALFTDLDQNLLGDPTALSAFLNLVRENRQCVSFGIATGRGLESALAQMKRFGIPLPDVLITGVGTEIHYAPDLTADLAWRRHINYMWNPDGVIEALADIPGVSLQPKLEQSRFKVSYYIDTAKAPSIEEINSVLHRAELTVSSFLSFGQYLDIIPVRASKGLALRYFSTQWDIPLDHILAAGGSGTDADMMRGNTLGVVVANRHDEELVQLSEIERIYFAKRPFAAGIMEAIAHYDFLATCRAPGEQGARA